MRLLVVDDERQLANSLKDYFEAEGIEVETAHNGAEGKTRLENKAFDIVVSDLRMPGMDGLQLLSWLHGEGQAIPMIMISAHGEIEDAVQAMKLGAYDYMVKPFDPDELLLRIRKAVEARRLKLSLEAGLGARREGYGLLGESGKMLELGRLIAKAAPSTATILVTGESGTGKEVVARKVHALSGREGPFVPINMGAFPDQLLESELFGYEKGAFTGADTRKLGIFESAQGGTLFLDEVAEMPLHLQVKLLRVLQERKVQRLGSLKGTPIDVRIVAATNKDLELEVREGRFREDLYYRLNVIRLRVPPLRERRSDIPLLAGSFLARFSADLGRKILGMSEEAMQLLLGYEFPGNVRELENVIERACILAEGEVLESIDFEFIHISGEKPQAAISLEGFASKMTLQEMEKRAIMAALGRNAFHREKTAQELGITRRTLLNKIKEYELGGSEVEREDMHG
ncbi:MAG: Fis family two component sigma-54 specific transcriptional regulator [Spirochaetes bacterium]|nr:MAG: Fis family two component sigma-54 specific transcriptional regulator [Spirochaetota bacterium]